MTNLFVPYEESIELKELGFDEPCFGARRTNGDRSLHYAKEGDLIIELNADMYASTIKAPTFQQAFDFFEKKFNLYGDTYTYTEELGNKQPKFGWEIRDYGEQWDMGSGFNTKLEAKIDCLRKLISIAKEAPSHMFAFGYVLPEEITFEVIEEIGEYKVGDKIVIYLKDESKNTFDKDKTLGISILNKQFFKKIKP